MIRLLIRNDPTRFMVPFFWALGVAYGLLMADAANEDFAGYGPESVSCFIDDVARILAGETSWEISWTW